MGVPTLSPDHWVLWQGWPSSPRGMYCALGPELSHPLSPIILDTSSDSPGRCQAYLYPTPL